MVISQKNKGLCNYFEVSEIQGAEGYEVNMLLNNNMQYIPALKLQEIDNRTHLSYKIDGLMTLSKYYGRKPPDMDEIKSLLYGIKCGIEEMKPFLLSAHHLVLDMNYILYDSREGRYQFLYVPGYGKDFHQQMKSLFEDIMLIFDHQDNAGVSFLYDAYSRFLEENYSPELFCGFVQGFYNNKAKVQEHEYRKKQELPEDFFSNEIYFSEVSQEGTWLKREDYTVKWTVKSIIIAAFLALSLGAFLFLREMSYKIIAGLTVFCFLILTILSIQNKEESRKTSETKVWVEEQEPSETQVWNRTDEWRNPEERTVSRLVPYMNQQREPILIMEGRMKIGRVMNMVDYCMDAPGISRIHAEIEKRDGIVTLMDAGSTNGTYVNHIRLLQNQKKEIKYGDIVSFAGEEYYCL